MKCTCSPSVLSQSLSLVSRAVSPRSTLPILSNVLLETAQDGLHLTATNLDLTIRATVEAEVAAEGRITVPARLLADYVASLSEAPCNLEVDPANQVLRLSCGIHRTNIHGIDAVEFPPLPARDADTTVELDSATLEAAIAQSVVAASGDEARPVLTGVLLQVEPDHVTLAATDGHRLAVRTVAVEAGDDEAPVSAQVDGADVQIAFNARYVLDALAVIDADQVQMGFNGPLSPGVVRPLGRSDYLYVVMPVRVPM